MKWHIIKSVLLILVLSFWRLSANGAEESPERQQNANSRGEAVSDKIVVKDVVYGLEADAHGLFLTSQGLNENDRVAKRVKVEFTVPADGRIVELALAKLGIKNLVAVVRLKRGDEYEFHCLTFIAASGGHVHEKHAYYQVKFFTTDDRLRILALDGRQDAGSVFVVIGKRNWENRGESSMAEITEGMFFFSGCPWPPEGQISPFRAESLHSLKGSNSSTMK